MNAVVVVVNDAAADDVEIYSWDTLSWRGGEEGTQQSFIQGGSAPRSKPSSFHNSFLTEEVTLSYTLIHRKWYPFDIHLHLQ